MALSSRKFAALGHTLVAFAQVVILGSEPLCTLYILTFVPVFIPDNWRSSRLDSLSRDNVDVSTDDEDFGRPSTSEGNYKSYRYSSLKRAADDEDAVPSGTTSDPVTRQETPQID